VSPDSERAWTASVVSSPSSTLTLLAASGPAGWLSHSLRGGGFDASIAHSLRADGHDASEDGTGRGVPLITAPLTGNPYADHESRESLLIPFDTTQITSVTCRSNPRHGDPSHPLSALAHAPAIAFDCKASGRNGFGVGEQAPTLRSMGHADSHQSSGGQVAVMTLAIRGRRDSHDLECREDGIANAVLTPNGGRAGIGVGAIARGMAVRRLTPRECERLQGFPDDYTLISPKTPDGPRYKALGNSMAVPVMRWIGERIAMVDTL
jgi:DNA (cytosine-5)-methyltransferase 1